MSSVTNESVTINSKVKYTWTSLWFMTIIFKCIAIVWNVCIPTKTKGLYSSTMEMSFRSLGISGDVFYCKLVCSRYAHCILWLSHTFDYCITIIVCIFTAQKFLSWINLLILDTLTKIYLLAIGKIADVNESIICNLPEMITGECSEFKVFEF